jgi:flagellar basal-body rod protein FlgG
MNTGRIAALITIAAVTLLAILVGHFVLRSEADLNSANSNQSQIEPTGESDPDSEDVWADIEPSDEPGHFVTTAAERASFTASIASDQPLDDAQPSPAPKKLSGTNEASPIDNTTKANDAMTRSIIRSELRQATDEEQEAWLNELRGLPPGAVREMLRIRRALHPTQPVPLVKPFPLTNPAPKAVVSAPTLIPSPPVAFRPPSPHETFINNFNPPPAVQPSLIAIQQAIDVIANNIANANTVGFKRSRVEMSSLPYLQVVEPGQQDSQGKLSASGIAVGMGVEVATTRVMHTQGALRQTTRSLDLAIVGRGLFQIQTGNGTLYARAGRFGINADGEVVLTGAGRSRLIEPALTIPQDALSITISTEGGVSVLQPGSTTQTQVGQIQLARFTNPAGLTPRSDGLFSATDASGSPQLGNAGLEGRGIVKSRYLEASNVVLRDELAELVRLKTQLDALRQIQRILAGTSPPLPISPAVSPAIPPATPAPLAKRNADPTSGPKLSRRPAPSPR